MSKRGLSALVEDKIVRGWDDPRLYTLVALRRRGVPPGAILSFINELGVTTSRTFIQVNRFEQSVRKYLETTVPRLMLVLDPVALVIEDEIDPGISERRIPSPTSELNGQTQLLTQTIFIERSDFREADSKDYFRLAPGKTVGLIQSPYPVKVSELFQEPNHRRRHRDPSCIRQGLQKAQGVYPLGAGGIQSGRSACARSPLHVG